MIELSYGELPRFPLFLQQFIKVMDEKSGKYAYDLVGSDIKIASRVGIPVKGLFTATELYIVVEKLTRAWDEESDKNAGDLASSILKTLDFQWL